LIYYQDWNLDLLTMGSVISLSNKSNVTRWQGIDFNTLIHGRIAHISNRGDKSIAVIKSIDIYYNDKTTCLSILQETNFTRN
jgi:hypothetical protein